MAESGLQSVTYSTRNDATKLVFKKKKHFWTGNINFLQILHFLFNLYPIKKYGFKLVYGTKANLFQFDKVWLSKVGNFSEIH